MELSRERERLLGRISTRRGREKEGVVLVEGPRAVQAARSAGASFVFALVSDGAAGELARGDGPHGRIRTLAASLEAAGVPVVRVPDPDFASLVDAGSPQGIAAVVREPRPDLPPPEDARREAVLVLDGVQDPGNAGTLVRSAAAFGVDRVLALDGTVDPWNPKAVRASAGLAFRIPLHAVPWERARRWLEAAGLPLLAADASGADVRRWPEGGVVPDGWALLVGNEGEGARPEALEAAAAVLAVPVAPGVDSLNVAMAGTLLLWALGPGAVAARGLP